MTSMITPADLGHRVRYVEVRQIGKSAALGAAYGVGTSMSWFDDLGIFIDPREPQNKIRRAIKSNERKARSQSGRHRGRKWLMSKQSQCAIYGHVHKQNGMACYYCGYEMES